MIIRILVVLIFVIMMSACSSVRPDRQMPVYGCWCGPNFPPSNTNPDPIDRWDEACKEHDLCYREYGRNDEECDLDFVVSLEFLSADIGYAPGQMQVAYGIFKSRLTPGQFSVGGNFTLSDIIDYNRAGKECLLEESNNEDQETHEEVNTDEVQFYDYDAFSK